MNMTEFLDMGGYGAYVWSAYALTALVLVANVLAARVSERAAKRSLEGRLKRESRVRRS